MIYNGNIKTTVALDVSLYWLRCNDLKVVLKNCGSMDVTYTYATSISKALPAHSNASTLSRRSVSNGINLPEYTSFQESEPRNSNHTAIFSVPNREVKVKQEEQDKGIWNFLKNKLKPRKKEKGNFTSYIESNGRQDQVLCSSINQNEPNFSHVINYNFLRAQRRPFHKETKFRASTIDSRRLHTKTVSSQILWRPKREEKPLIAKTRCYRPNLLYLCDGTAERIDRWLTESEAFMRADDHQSTIATAVVGSHRRTSQQIHSQTCKQNGKQDKLSTSPLKTKDKQISGIHQLKNVYSHYDPTSKKSIVMDHLPTNLFRQSSRSANHLSVSEIKAEAFLNCQRNRPLSDFDCQEMSSNQYIKNLQEPPYSNIVLDKPETQNIIRAASKTPFKAAQSALDCEQMVRASDTSNSPGCDVFSKVSRFEDTNRVKSLESIHTNKDEISKPQSRDHSVQTEGSRTHTFSSESLNNLSCNESYCTDYTPYAFEEKFRRPHTNSSCREAYQRDTPFSHKSEPSAKDTFLAETNAFSKIQTENNLRSIRKFISKDGSQFYHTPNMAKFVTTIYLTGDESNLDLKNINLGNTFIETHEQNYHQPFDRRTKALAQRYLENVAHESSKLEIKTQEFISKDKQIPSDVSMIAPKGMEIHARAETALPSTKCIPESLRNDEGDLHLDIDIFDLKTNNMKEGNSLWKHSHTGDCDEGKYEDGTKSAQAENILHRNLFESPRDDRKMCCSNKISDIRKRGSPLISNSPIDKDRQILKNESLHENILACPQRSESIEKKVKLKVSTNKSSNSEVGLEESEVDPMIQPILEEHLSIETKHLANKKISDYESDNESLKVFDEPPFQTCAITDEVAQVSQAMKIFHSKIPGSERQSPPLNSFTSRSTLSLFEEFNDICSESPLNTESRFSVIPSATDLPMVGRETDNTETHTYSIEKEISSNDNLRLSDSSDASRNSDEPLLDLRAFMTVKHNDHARIFDLCFGNSPAFNKTSLLPGNDKDLTGVQISDWKSVESHHCKDSRPFYNSIQSQPKKETHISNLHAINRARAFFV